MGEEKHISTEELAKHNSAEDVWISIQGKVYDVTTWLKDHPGGDLLLLNLAGQDVTDAFVAYHPGSAWQHLHRFYIGRLDDYKVSEVSKDYRRLVSEFSKLGLFENKGHGVFIAFVTMVVLMSISIYVVIWSKNPWVHLACGGLMGFTWIQSGWIGHDSGHYQVMTNKAFNRFVQVLTGNCLAGISIGWWKRNHNAHHMACNSLQLDPDLQHMPLFVVSSDFFNSLTSYDYREEKSAARLQGLAGYCTGTCS
ncbi:hypothetical protein AAC387_Pa11g0395 [Persea americana]